MDNVGPGSIIKGYYWPEPVEVKLIEESGDYIHIVGATTVSRNHIDQIILREDFLKLYIEGKGPDFSEDPWKVFLAHCGEARGET